MKGDWTLTSRIFSRVSRAPTTVIRHAECSERREGDETREPARVTYVTWKFEACFFLASSSSRLIEILASTAVSFEPIVVTDGRQQFGELGTPYREGECPSRTRHETFDRVYFGDDSYRLVGNDYSKYFETVVLCSVRD